MNKINMSIIAEQLNISRQAVSQMFSEDHSINNMTYQKIVEKLPEVAECFEQNIK